MEILTPNEFFEDIKLMRINPNPFTYLPLHNQPYCECHRWILLFDGRTARTAACVIVLHGIYFAGCCGSGQMKMYLDVTVLRGQCLSSVCFCSWAVFLVVHLSCRWCLFVNITLSLSLCINHR